MECINLFCGNYVLIIYLNVQLIENFNDILYLKKMLVFKYIFLKEINVLRLLKSLVVNYVYFIV